MTKALRKLRKEAHNRNERDNARAANRRKAADAWILAPDRTIRDVAFAFNISIHIAHQIKKALRDKDDENLKKLLNPHDNRAGRKIVLDKEEDHLFDVAMGRFCLGDGVADKATILSAMAKIASDGRENTYKNDLPSSEAFRAFRARHENFTFRRSHRKELAKAFAERHDHVETYAKALTTVFEKHPTLRLNTEAIINVDETEVRTVFGERPRALVPKTSRHGAPKLYSPGSEKHVTAVIAVSAAGRKAPPFFVVAGKSTLQSWIKPLEGPFCSLSGDIVAYTKHD